MPTLTKKNLIIISSGILTVAIIVLLAYLFYLNSKRNTEQTSNNQNQATNIPAPVIEAQKILDEELLRATIDTTNTIKYYRLSDGQVFRTNTLGEEPVVLDETTLTNITSVEWSKTTPHVITRVNNRFYTFNYAEAIANTFPTEVNSLQFLSNGRVFYTYVNPDKSVDLSIANPDSSNREKIITLSSGDVVLKNIPLANKVSQTLIPSSYRGSSLRIIDLTTKEASSVLEDKPGLNVSWAPDGKSGLISYTTERGGGTLSLSVVNAAGFELRSLAPAGTLAEKIVWSKDSTSAYFTKPKVANTQVMPDDYYSNNLGEFEESLYSVNIATAEVKLISDNIGKVDSRDLFLNEAETELFFINKRDNKLYKVTLE